MNRDPRSASARDDDDLATDEDATEETDLPKDPYAVTRGGGRRRVVVIDRGSPRNGASRASHGLFTRDGAAPSELLEIGRAQLAPYGAPVHDDEVTAIAREAPGFAIATRSGRAFESQR